MDGTERVKVSVDIGSRVPAYSSAAGKAMRSLIKENRNLVKSFLAAIVEAINFYRSNERETIEIMAAFAGTRDARPLQDSYRFHKRLFQQPPYPSAEGFKTVLAEIRDPAIDEKKVRSEQFFDRTLLDELKAK